MSFPFTSFFDQLSIWNVTLLEYKLSYIIADSKWDETILFIFPYNVKSFDCHLSQPVQLQLLPKKSPRNIEFSTKSTLEKYSFSFQRSRQKHCIPSRSSESASLNLCISCATFQSWYPLCPNCIGQQCRLNATCFTAL